MPKKFITKIEEKLIEDLLSEKLSSFRPSVSFKENAYNGFVKKTTGSSRFAFNFPRWVSAGTAALVVFLSLGVTTGYAYFSPNVNSQSNLYFLKKSVENVEYSLAFSEEDKIKTLVKFNEKRKEEIAVLAQEGVQDKIAMEEIEINLKESVKLLDKIDDVKIKQELLVLIEPENATDDQGEGKIEEDNDDDGNEDHRQPVIVEEDPKKTPVWNLGIILPPQPTMNLSQKLLAPQPEGDLGGGGDEADGLGMGDEGEVDYGVGGGGSFVEDYDVDFGDAFELSPAPVIIPLQPLDLPELICKSVCKNGASQACEDGGMQYCGDFDRNGCTEWGKCTPVRIEDPEEDEEIFFEPISLPVIEPIIEPVKPPVEPIKPVVEPAKPTVEPIKPVVEPVKPTVVTPTITPIKIPVIEPIVPIKPFNFGF